MLLHKTKMSASMNPTALFQHYVQKMFKFPKEIKHDIVYCQRALKAHIKVHQMVLDVYKTQANPDPVEKHRITDELESQIYEINAEQQFLLLRLRRMISDFHKFLERKGVLVIPSITNEFISSELVPLINDETFLIYPIGVRLRCTEQKLIEKYFEAKNEMTTNYYEILDSDEEEQHDSCPTEQTIVNYKPIYNKSTLKNLRDTKDKGQSSTSQFVELCSDTVKGSSRSVSKIAPNITVSKIRNTTVPSNSTTTTSSEVKELIYPVSIQASKTAIERQYDDSSVSQNVRKSRLNLREVLKNVQSGHISARVGPTPSQNQFNVSTIASKTSFVPSTKLKQNIQDAESHAVSSTTPTNSSSEDSTPERCIAPQKMIPQLSAENNDRRLKPEEYGQEMFLRLFGLFTPEMHLQMQQRRSKRKRRTVQNNERSDYHYGHIDCTPDEDKKKRKAFLLSPQVKRAQGRPPKPRSIEKSDETTSRSSSSSPDDKRTCNECLKFGGTFEQCESCKQYYHQFCHSSKNFNEKSKKTKSCPSCLRQLQNRCKTEAQQYKTLRSNADKLKQKMTLERTRHKNLQRKSEKFKTEMNKLFNIIRTIKRDSVNDCE